MSNDVILEVKSLVTAFQTDDGSLVRAVDGVSFKVRKGRTLGIVGESGCGKSVTSLSIMRLLPKPAGQILHGEILFQGKDILKLSPGELHSIRGNRIAMVFQEPMTALNPVKTIGSQLAEVFELHFPALAKGLALQGALIDVLQKVAIPEPEKRLRQFPHQLSGGMRQRVMIAMALACKPDVLICDEPTTALDVTIQAQILELIKKLQQESGMAVIFITHALGVIAELCDDVIVMYAGKVVEEASVNSLFRKPKHPYTRGLLESIPKLTGKRKSKLKVIEGIVPSLGQFPKGCRFQNRCPYATEECRAAEPALEITESEQRVACFHWQEIAKKPIE